MTLLEQFAALWGLKVEGNYIVGVHGYIMECNGQLWVWTHSHAPNGHQFFPVATVWDEVKAMIEMMGFGGEW